MQKNLKELPDFVFHEIENIISPKNEQLGSRRQSNRSRQMADVYTLQKKI